MSTGLIIYIIVCIGIAIGRLESLEYSFPEGKMIRFILLAPIAVPILIGCIITIIAEYIKYRMTQINNNTNNN